ncbi:MAG: RICIN domain-containing protein, partial [Cellulomonas sp.]|nr:RICIN domain-containing protein [Cellulomonas sp.]
MPAGTILLSALARKWVQHDNDPGGYQYEHYFATQTGVVADVSQAKYPRALLLQHQADPADDGVMLGSLQVYYGNTDADDAKRHIPVFRSDDLGKTWDYSYSGVYNQVDRGPGYELTSQGQLYELPVAVGDMPAGTILLSALARKWVQHDNDPGGYSSYIDVYKSSDVGKTWQYVSTVAQGGTAVEGKDPIWEPFLYAYDRGDGGPNRLVVYYSDERPSYVGQMLVHQVSTDGLSWGPVVWDVFDAAEGRTPSASYATPGRPGMFSMAEMNDGRYIATYEYCGTAVSQTAVGGCAVNYRISDDPENWQQDANRNYQVQIPDTGYRPVGTPYVTNLPNVGPHGAVVVSGNGSRNGVFVSYDYGAPGSWVYYYSSVFTSYSRSLVTMPDGRSMFAVSSPAAPAVEWARGTQYLADASPVVADGTWRLESAATAGAYLKVADDDTRTGVSDNGKPTQGWVTQGADSVSTAWRLVPATGAAGWYRVQNVNSGLYLDIEAGSTANAANVFQQGLDPSSGSQLWRLRDMGNGHVLLMNRKSGKTINPTSTQVPQGKLVQYPEGAPTGSGLSIASYEAGGSFSQQWVLTRVNPVRDPSVTTQASVAPVLPTSVEVSTGGVVYGDAASTEQAPVAWDALDPASYAAPGTVQVPGTATFAGLTYPVTATVQVVAPDPPAVSFTTPATGASVSGTVTVTVALSVLGLQAYNLRV